MYKISPNKKFSRESSLIKENLAIYASLNSRGRLHTDYARDYRNPFARDRDRIIHSAAFRRLEYKTQVFVNSEGDHYRTRLTHSLEVAQITRAISRELRLEEDLAETIALAHDLGHPPFGHAGEEALNELMLPYGGFNHNTNSLKLITKLEKRYAEFDGLNLSWESLEGIVKHNGPLKQVDNYIREFDQIFPLDLHNYPSLEAQIASMADEIAYNNHDLEDGLRADLFTLEDLATLPLLSDIYKEVYNLYPHINRH